MKLIFDNIIFNLQNTGGISVVWYNILSRILNKTSEFSVNFLEYNHKNKNIFQQKLNLPQQCIQRRKMAFFNLNRYFSPKIQEKEKFIFHSSYYRICKNPNAINITTVHDFTYEYFVKGLKKHIHMWQKNYALRKSNYIVCISENTKKDLIKFLPDIPSNKIRVIYNGVSEEFQKLNHVPYPEYKDYILFLGSRAEYKNFKFVVDSIKNTKFKLLICGAPLNNKEQQYISNIIPTDHYKVMSGISNQELNKLYNSVFCLAYPSSYEGFGLPVIEAQKAGCPVIALNSSSIPEIIGNSYPMLTELTIEKFKVFTEKLENEEYKAKIINLGLENSKQYSWENMFSNYYNLYLEAAKTEQ